MARLDPRGKHSFTTAMAGFVIVVAALYFAKAVLVPLALAILLSFLLSPLAIRLQRWGLPRIAAVIVVAILSFAVLGGIGWVVWHQVADLASKLPQYRDNIQAKIELVQGSLTRTMGRTSQMIDDITRNGDAGQQQPQQPQTLYIAPSPQPADSPLRTLGAVMGPLLKPLGTAGLVIVFVLFILYQREDLRDRMIRLVSPGQLNLTTQALDEAAHRVSRYLLMQLVVNVTYGIPIAIGLYFIGVPNAVLWGFLCTVLRFIPYLGPWIAAAMPISLSLAVSEGWAMPLYTVGLFLVVELISNNLAEPLLYGASTGMSPVAVLVAAVFWTWLWGTAGLLLATPLTVCLAVIGKYVPQLNFLNVLLGDEPVLEPKARLYQRLLAGDPEEAAELVEEYLGDHSLVEVYDQVMVPALGLAEQDHHRGELDEARHQFILQSVREIIDDLGERNNIPELKHEDGSEQRVRDSGFRGQASNPNLNPEPRTLNPPIPGQPASVLVLPAHDDADEMVAMMLAQVLETRGCRARYVSVKALASEMVDTVARQHHGVVCISALPPAAITHARYLCKRLVTRLGDIRLIVGLWTVRADLTHAASRLRFDSSGQVVRSLAEAVEAASPLLQTLAAQGSPPKLQPAIA